MAPGVQLEYAAPALRLATSADGDRRLSTDELRRHVSRTVSDLTGGRQTPPVDRDNVFHRFSLPITPR